MLFALAEVDTEITKFGLVLAVRREKRRAYVLERADFDIVLTFLSLFR